MVSPYLKDYQNREMNDRVLLQLEDVKKHFLLRRSFSGIQVVNKAVDGVSFSVNQKETFAVVGESGCGKSTLGRVILQLTPITEGRIIFDGSELTSLTRNDLRRIRCNMQIIFQDPYASLNPRMSIGNIISEPLVVHGIGDNASRKNRVRELLSIVGLPSSSAKKYAHEFSGGQRQRIGIARALAINPRLIICDEPVSALDVSIQSQILNLLEELQIALGLTYIFISHNLSVVDHISDRVAVMYLGKIMEMGETQQVFNQKKHPYTQALLSAIPIFDPDTKIEKIILEGDVPSPVNPPSGCCFRTRCWKAQERCEEETPAFREISKGHFVACHFA